MLPYTVCFCFCGTQVLMLYRSKPPNAGRWNGLGGKIEAGETPLRNIHREMMEEAEIDLKQARTLRFAGLVTWVSGDDPTLPSRGMYAFLARLAPDFLTWPDRPMAEGLLSWKSVDWACDPGNSSVVSNIPRFLPDMLESSEPQEYRCFYLDGVLQGVIVHPLSPDLKITCDLVG